MSVSTYSDTTAATLLVVDDDTIAREHVRGILEHAGHRTITAADAHTALRFLHQQRCDLVMIDVELPDGSTGGQRRIRITARGAPGRVQGTI